MDKKIYLVSFEYFPMSNGGLARLGKEIIDRLVKKSCYRAIIAVPKNSNFNTKKQIVAIPCKFYNNKYLAYLEFTWKLYFLFNKEFSKSKFVLFSSYSYFLNPLLPKRFYFFVTNTLKRVLVTNYSEEQSLTKIRRKFIYFFTSLWEEYLCKKASKIFCISQSTQEDVVNHYKISPEKTELIECGLNKKIFYSTRVNKIMNKNLLYVGRLVPRKNLLDLIAIFKKLVSLDSQFRLQIVGDGNNSYKKKLQQKIIDNNLEKKVMFHGFISDKKLNGVYKKSSLFVFTSLVEGFGLVLLEAMSKGLPIVAYDVNGVRDVIINNINGYLIKPFNHQDFIDRVLLFYKNKKTYQQFSKNAIKRVDNFSWDKSVQVLAKALYE